MMKWKDPRLVRLGSGSAQGYCGNGSTPESSPGLECHGGSSPTEACSNGANPTKVMPKKKEREKTD